MSDVDLEEERARSRERQEEESDRNRSRQIGERLFWQADDKQGPLGVRTVNDAIAERVGFATFDGERMKRFITWVQEAYNAVQEQWRSTRPNPSEEYMTVSEYLEQELDAAEKRVGHPIERFGQNRMAALVDHIITRGLEKAVFSGGTSGIFYNHIRPLLIARGWEPNISFSHIGPIPEEEWEALVPFDAEKHAQEIVTPADTPEDTTPPEPAPELDEPGDTSEAQEECVDPVQESTQPEEELEEEETPDAPYECPLCGCTDLDCSECIEAQGHPCSWVDLGDHPTICSRCLNELLQEAFATRENQVRWAGSRTLGEALAESDKGPSPDPDVFDIASRRAAGPAPDGTLPVDHARMFLEGPWGSLSVIHPLEKGADASVYLQAQLSQATADRITALVLHTKFALEES